MAQSIESRLGAGNWTLRALAQESENRIKENRVGVVQTLPSTINIKQNKTYFAVISADTEITIEDDLLDNTDTDGELIECMSTIIWQNDDNVSELSLVFEGQPVKITGFANTEKANIINIYRSPLAGNTIGQVCFASIAGQMDKRGDAAPVTVEPTLMTLTDIKQGTYTDGIFGLDGSNTTAAAIGGTINPVSGNYVSMEYNTYRNGNAFLILAPETESSVDVTALTRSYAFFINGTAFAYYDNTTYRSITRTNEEGSVFRMRFDDSSGSMKIVYEVSTDGSNFTELASVNYTNTDAVNIHLNIVLGDRKIDNPKILSE